MNILNWTVETEEDTVEPEDFYDDGDRHYVIIKVNGEEVARNNGKDYVGCDCCGGGGPADVAIEMIRKAFACV